MAVQGEDLHSVISAVGDEDLAAVIYRQTSGVRKLPWLRPFHGFSSSIDGADDLENCVVLVEDLHTVIAPIHYKDSPVPVHSNISRSMKLARILALGADGLRDGPVLIENMHLVLLEIGNQNPTLQVNCDAARALEMGCANNGVFWEGNVRLDGSEMALDAPARHTHPTPTKRFFFS